MNDNKFNVSTAHFVRSSILVPLIFGGVILFEYLFLGNQTL